MWSKRSQPVRRGGGAGRERGMEQARQRVLVLSYRRWQSSEGLYPTVMVTEVEHSPCHRPSTYIKRPTLTCPYTFFLQIKKWI